MTCYACQSTDLVIALLGNSFGLCLLPVNWCHPHTLQSISTENTRGNIQIVHMVKSETVYRLILLLFSLLHCTPPGSGGRHLVEVQRSIILDQYFEIVCHHETAASRWQAAGRKILRIKLCSHEKKSAMSKYF